jgi:undecaprenyl-diphosphatase
MATTIERPWLRRAVIGVCSVIPVLVAYARLYRGMYHLSDVVVGAINGLACAALAAACLLHRRGEAPMAAKPPTVADLPPDSPP